MAAVVNWFWQGCVVACAAALVLRLFDQAPARIRCQISWAALAAILVLPLMPAAWNQAIASRTVAQVATSAITTTDHEPTLAATSRFLRLPETWWTSTGVLALIWAVWCFVHVTRIGFALWSRHEMKRRCGIFPQHLQHQLLHWQRVRVHGRPTQLRVSEDVGAAGALGGRSPVIAVAPALIAHLSPHELDAIVIHEWTHIQRRDDIAHLLQLVALAVAGWHPAVQWIARRLDVDREVACDEAAVATTGLRKEYAGCLVSLAAIPGMSRQPGWMLGALSGSPLADRVRRILSGTATSASAASKGLAVACALCLVTLAMGVGRLEIVAMRAPTAEPAWRGIGADIQLIGSQARASIVQAQPAVMVARPRPDGQRPRQMAPDRAATPAVAVAALGTGTTIESAIGAPAIGSPAAPEDGASGDASSSRSDETQVARGNGTARSAVGTEPPVNDTSVRTSWSAVATAGVAVGQGSSKASVAAAGWFTRFGKRVAAAF